MTCMLNLIWKIRWFNKMNKKNIYEDLPDRLQFCAIFSVLSGTQGVFGIMYHSECNKTLQ